MEKYSRFNDARSGVNPFAQQPYRPGAATLIMGLLWVSLKAPFIGLFGGLLLGLSEVSRLVSVPAFSWLLSFSLRFLARAVLWLFGFYSISETHVNKHSVRVRPSRSSPSSTVKNGDILLVNKCSYIDVLFLMAAYAAPTFTVTTQEGGLEEVSFLQALKASVLGVPQRWKQLPSGGKAGFTTAEESVDTIVRRNLSSGFRGPLVVFPEGAPTNNKAVLMFTPLIDQLERCVVTIARGHGDAAKLKVPTVHILALRYSNGSAGFLPCFTGGGRPLLHAYFVCAQGSNSLHVSRLPDNYEPQPADFINAASSASSSSSSAAGGAGGSSSSATGVAVANTGSDLQARKAAGISEGASTDDASAAAGGGGVSAATSWPFAVRDALTQLVGRGSKAVALGASHYDEYLALVEENNRIQQGQEQGGSKSGGSKRR